MDAERAPIGFFADQQGVNSLNKLPFLINKLHKNIA